MKNALLKTVVLCLFLINHLTTAAQNIGKQSTKQLTVQFTNDVVFEDLENINVVLLNQFPAFDREMSDLGFSYSLLPVISAETLHYLDQQSSKIGGPSLAVQALWRTFEIEIPNAEDEALNRIADRLKGLDKVKTCYFRSKIQVKLPNDIPPTTPDLSDGQGYITEDPGVNMDYAWELGVTGKGVRARDVEVGVNLEHEELNEKPLKIADGMTVSPVISTDYSEHGTAAVGVILSDSGNYGVSGLQFGIDELISFPIVSVEKGYDVSYAISQSIMQSKTGDVIMYELQSPGSGGPNSTTTYAPQEYDLTAWNLTKAATDAGIVIVAAAGNGNQNLDGEEYEEYMQRGHSGAIIVGAGEPNTSHRKADFSTFGSRVDLQGWGTNVLAPGYGYAYKFGNDFNQQYVLFTGTSAATPIVTSCVIALQSYYHNATGNYLTGTQICKILVETGIPQTGDTSEKVGPLPNMKAALERLKSETYINEENNKINFALCPNPVNDRLSITSFTVFSDQILIITDALGKTVFSSTFNSRLDLDVSTFAAGIYFVKLDNRKESLTQKFIKN